MFGQPGDAAETVALRYGAVMYTEEACVYTISASTDNAYNAAANKFIRTGEEVYLSCYSDAKHTGTGIVTSVSGTDFTVEARSGTFLIGESVNVFRGMQRSRIRASDAVRCRAARPRKSQLPAASFLSRCRMATM